MQSAEGEVVPFFKPLKARGNVEKWLSEVEEFMVKSVWTVLKKGLRVNAKFLAYKDKLYYGEIISHASRVDAQTRSILARAQINNKSLEILPGSLLDIELLYDEKEDLIYRFFNFSKGMTKNYLVINSEPQIELISNEMDNQLLLHISNILIDFVIACVRA